MGKALKSILIAVIFVICVALIIVGQKSIGAAGLLTMVAGLAGLLALLFVYNRKYNESAYRTIHSKKVKEQIKAVRFHICESGQPFCREVCASFLSSGQTELLYQRIQCLCLCGQLFACRSTLFRCGGIGLHNS